MTATATTACAPAATRRTSTASARSATSSTPSSAAAASGFGPAQGGDVAVAVEIDLVEAANGATVEVSYDAVDALRALPRQRRRAGHADRDVRALRRRRAAAERHPDAARPDGPHDGLRPLPRRRTVPERAVRASAAAAGQRRGEARARRRDPRRDRRRPADPDERPRQRGRARRARRATSTCWSASARTSASCAKATT